MSRNHETLPEPLAPDAPELPRPTTLWLVRHAEVEARYQSVFGGRIDMELSPRGHEQAAALARYLAHERFDALYASPMRRAQQTLAPLLVNGVPQPVALSELREVDFGDWTGLGWDEVQSRFGISPFQWLDQLDCAGIPNAECGADFRARVEPALRGILRRHQGQRVLILCHGGVIRMVLALLFQWPLPRMAAFEIEYASVTQVLCTPEKFTFHLVNFTPWRELKI